MTDNAFMRYLGQPLELLLKAVLVHKAGPKAIRDKGRAGMTIGFDACLRKCFSDASVKCLTEDEVVSLQSQNTLRDAAQHYMIELSNEHLYIYAQAGLSLFTKIGSEVFKKPLANEIPRRILPVCAKPPTDLAALFDIEFSDIKKMSGPGSRRRLDAKMKLRSMAILQASLDGRKTQPSDEELDQVVKRITNGEGWKTIFPGVATLSIVTDAGAVGLSLRITKKSGEAITIVPEGSPEATVIAVRRVNELDYYSLGARDIAEKLKVGINKLLWFIKNENLQADPNHFKEIRIGASKYKRYSQKALDYCAKKFSEVSLNLRYSSWQAGG